MSSVDGQDGGDPGNAPTVPSSEIPEIKVLEMEISENDSKSDSDGNKLSNMNEGDRKVSWKQPSLSGISEDESVSEETDRMRKVSILVGPGGEHTRQYIPYRSGPPSEYHIPHAYARASPSSRKSSLDAFFVQPHQRMSVVSVMSSTPDTFETVPHADHYRDISLFVNDIRQRPTLDELRVDEVSL